MTATATLIPPSGNGLPLTAEYVSETLVRMGITYGVMWDTLTELLFQLNTERTIMRDIPVATGTVSQPEYPEHIVIEERFIPGFRPVTDDQLNIDWKAISPVRIVKAGDLVGTVIPRQEGVTGMDVLGRPTQYRKETFPLYVLSKNVERRDSQVLATTEGRVVLDGLKISVEEVLIIKGDVDYRVGHVLFPGDVVIEGGIASGFKVYAGGSISIKDTMDAFDISSKKDLVCAQGIVGHGQGMVKVGGTLKSKFIENALIAVRRDVETPGSIVGSKLYVLGSVRMGDKGRIVGGELYATHGVICGTIGGPTLPVTLVHAGVDFTAQKKLEQANAALRELSSRLSRLQELARSRPETAILAARDQAEARMRALASHITELTRLVYIDETATIEVRSAVYPGTVISICHMSLNVTEQKKKTRFRLDATANKIVQD